MLGLSGSEVRGKAQSLMVTTEDSQPLVEPSTFGSEDVNVTFHEMVRPGVAAMPKVVLLVLAWPFTRAIGPKVCSTLTLPGVFSRWVFRSSARKGG